MKKIYLAAFVFGVFSVSSSAEMMPYVGGNIGIGGITSPDADIDNMNYSQESGKLAWSLNTGLLFNSEMNNKFQYGAEVSYSTYATNENRFENLKFDYDGYNIAALGVAKYNFNNKWSIFGKAGAAYTVQELTSNVNVFNKKESKVLPKIGLGASYNITDNFAINASFEHIFGDDLAEFTNKPNNHQLSDYTNVGSVSTMYIGMGYSF
ncbi:outer membrane beta-barrel protein [Aliivibrio fischeri]|uniref:outer membrane protein n=1 Tax=Aliivibrio fischeri TaxID=668 RepID=UPI0012D88A01|nr:outer membrane beta-barrel protein [Aliivibrio fischeri]MCE7556006.1 outer membrane beta-barrel protein [Aliivibrio fischeri]MCE7562854.1 outer membrane beta-barrel protein [Aliivibrio fischeri]MCE7570941.1 outer membrane beta-barrel protein [Aliivibrio fischeri]MUK62842.1 outer membrane beta-barrel protein [Aliivibrio fischeri]MUK92027.1 outer membrane beta-barrel protein [Aliivibrio fischeri]